MAGDITKRTTPLSESVALLDSIELLAESLRTSRELMNAQEAADFLRMPYSEFRRLAPYLPRHPVTERRYIYHRNELLEWVLTR
jgi:hypothetical protein